MDTGLIVPLNSNNERLYKTPQIYTGSGVTPVKLQPYDDTSWVSNAYIYQISESTAFISGSFKSLIDANTVPLCQLPDGYAFATSNDAVNPIVIMKADNTYITGTALGTGGNISGTIPGQTLEVENGVTIDTDYVVFTNFAIRLFQY